MKGVSFDPGADCAWSAGELAKPGQRVHLLGMGVLDRGIAEGRDDRVAEARDLLARFNPDVVLVETVLFVVDRAGLGAHMAGHLVRAARLGGRLYQLAEDHGFAVEEVAAETWRRFVVGKSTAENAEIAPVVKMRFANWPKKSNNHERDAGGLLVYGLERALRAELAHPSNRMFMSRS